MINSAQGKEIQHENTGCEKAETRLCRSTEDGQQAHTEKCQRSPSQLYAAEDGEKALDLFYNQHIDLIVCDVMMLNMDGFELVRTLRDYRENVPIILLTAKAAFSDKREGFSMDTDDYMTKPVDYEELLWRIRALLRRANINAEQKLQAGSTTLNAADYTVSRVLPDGSTECINVPKKEFQILYKLLSSPGQIFTRDQLLEDIWGLDSDTNDSTIKTHINRLRTRFDGWTDFSIVTIRGLGYKGIL